MIRMFCCAIVTICNEFENACHKQFHWAERKNRVFPNFIRSFSDVKLFCGILTSFVLWIMGNFCFLYFFFMLAHKRKKNLRRVKFLLQKITCIETKLHSHTQPNGTQNQTKREIEVKKKPFVNNVAHFAHFKSVFTLFRWQEANHSVQRNAWCSHMAHSKRERWLVWVLLLPSMNHNAAFSVQTIERSSDDAKVKEIWCGLLFFGWYLSSDAFGRNRNVAIGEGKIEIARSDVEIREEIR